MSYFSATEIQTKITNISNAIDTILSGGTSYSLNDSHGTIQVNRGSLRTLQDALDYWLSKYNELDQDADIVSVRVGR